MATFNNLITRAYRLSGVLGDNEEMQGSQTEDGLLALNEMIDSWNSDNLNIYTYDILSCDITGNKQTYTIGIGGDINSPRPPDISGAWFQQLTTPPYVDIPLTIISQMDWGNLVSKGIPGNISNYLYYDGNYPLGGLWLWPIPSGGGKLIIHATKLLDSAVTLLTDVNLPPAYAMAIRYNLAMQLCAENGLEPSVTVLNTAVRTKRLMEENNSIAVQRMGFDSASLGTGGGRYMITSDQVWGQ
jgi:hypothetical protein